MGTLIDILGGLFIGGFLLLIAMSASDTATTEFFNYNSDAIVQQNLTQLSRVIQYDLRKMGYNIPEARQTTILQVATPNHLKFLTHLNSSADCRLPVSGLGLDDIADTIEYTITPFDSVDYGDTTVVIYQVVRSVKIPPNYSRTERVGAIGNADVFRYLDQIGNPVPVISATKMVEVTLTDFNPRVVLSRDYVDNRLSAIPDSTLRRRELRRLLRASFWRQTRLISRNLRR